MRSGSRLKEARALALRPFLFTVAMLTLALWPVTAGAVGIVSSAAVSETETGMRFEMQITGTVQARAYVLDNPYRVVIDMPTVEFRVPQGTGLKPVGFVKEFRYGLVGKDRARIIFEVDGPTLAGAPRLTTGPDGKTMLLSLDPKPTRRVSWLGWCLRKRQPKSHPLIWSGLSPSPSQQIQDRTGRWLLLTLDMVVQILER
jgi:AMIN domain